MGTNQGVLNYFFKARPASQAELKRGKRQLRRIETLTDCVFALFIFMIIFELPLPADEGITNVPVKAFLLKYASAFTPVLIAIILVVLFWIQNNVLFGYLAHTDDRHTTIFIVQVFSLLFYFYTIGFGIDLDNPPDALALQSIAVFLVGVCSLAGWSYASRNRRLIADEVKSEEIQKVRIRLLAEPITALITLACSPLGGTVWEISWLSYPLVALVVKQKAGKTA